MALLTDRFESEEEARTVLQEWAKLGEIGQKLETLNAQLGELPADAPGREALETQEPAISGDETETMIFDGLTFSEDLLEDDETVVSESEFDSII